MHFGHSNILSFDARPFRSIEAHDEFLINEWNANVDIDDDVWILGDISWHNSTKTLDILKRLNGNLHLCIGNHDHKFLRNEQLRARFVEIVHYKEIQLPNNKGIVLCHYPIPCFNNHFYGWYHLYGHVHSSFEWNMTERARYESEELYGNPCNMINVGCMLPYMQYRPQTLEEIQFGYAAYKEGLLRSTSEVSE